MKKLLITLALLTTNAAHANFLHGLERDINSIAQKAPNIRRDINAGKKAVKQGEKAVKAETSKIGRRKPANSVTQTQK